QAIRNLHRDEPTGGPADEMERSVTLDLENARNVMFRHLLDRYERVLLTMEPHGLDAVDRIVCPQRLRQFPVTENATADRMDAEDRRLVCIQLNRNDAGEVARAFLVNF